jgi:predicted enzyme related to lactoylglutathione lyase
MKSDQLIVNITSERPDELGKFYREVVQLEPMPEAGEHAFKSGNAMFAVDGHSETKGAAKEPHRVLISFMVDDLAGEQKRLEDQGVKFIRSAGKEFWGGVISTFTDPDGNYIQLIEFKP